MAGQAVGTGLHLDTFHLTGVELAEDGLSASVLPGTIQRTLDQAAATVGMTFGPETATSDRATLGGMVGNNSAGARSVVYGLTSDRLEWLDVVLADGSVGRFGETDGSSLASGISGLSPERSGELASGLNRIRQLAGPLVADRYPTLLRHVDGYALDELVKPRPNLARFLAGSEGTLALTTRVGVSLDPRPAERALAILSFVDVAAAVDAVPALLALKPSAVELMDRSALAHVREGVGWLGPLDAGALLYCEFQGELGSAADAVVRLPAHAGLGAAAVVPVLEPERQARAWHIRERGLAATQAVTRPGTLPAFVDDTAVAPERLGEYLRELNRIIESYGTHAVMFGHASVGCLHIYPLIDVRTAAGVQDMESMASEIVDLVRSFDGALSGEHGDGLSKSQWLSRYFGPEVVELFGEVKRLFDPDGLLNPGKIVDPEPMAAHLRYGASYRVRALAEPFAFSGQGGGVGAGTGGGGGQAAAVEQCFGAGACKKVSGGMCPPAMATRSELHTTRARANALRSVLTGDIALGDLGSDEMREVMETCVGCKACESECPVGVDMATLKTDWLWRVHEEEGVPLRARLIGDLRQLTRVGAVAPGLANRLASSPLARRLLAQADFDPSRTLPVLAPRRFTAMNKATKPQRRPRAGLGGGSADSAVSGPRVADVAIYADCFTDAFDPDLGRALVRVLHAQEREFVVPRAGCCGRTAWSEGLVERARVLASQTAHALAPFAAAGVSIAVAEPSCLSMIRDDWKRLLPGDDEAEPVARAVRSAEEVVLERPAPWLRPAGEQVVLQSHCHEQALGGSEATVAMLELVPGVSVDQIASGCCGMAGGFGYQANHHDLSVAIAEHAVAPRIRAATGHTIIATGFSCRTQIHDLTARVALHPLDYLARHLK